MSRLVTSDGTIRPPERVVRVMACFMMTVWSLVTVGVTQAAEGALAFDVFVWAGWLALTWGLIGWPGLRGREYRWVVNLYFATWGRLLGDHRLKKK